MKMKKNNIVPHPKKNSDISFRKTRIVEYQISKINVRTWGVKSPQRFMNILFLYPNFVILGEEWKKSGGRGMETLLGEEYNSWRAFEIRGFLDTEKTVFHNGLMNCNIFKVSITSIQNLL